MKTRFALLLLAFTAIGCTDAVLGPEASTDRGAIFDDLWSEVDRRYPYLEYKHLDWAALGAQYRPQAVAAADDATLAKVLGRLLEELRDMHVSITPGPTATPLRYVGPHERTPAVYDVRTVDARLTSASATSGGHLRYGMAGADVGYVRIASFAGGDWNAEMDEALRAMPNARSLILDVRDNKGGSRNLALSVAGRFAASEQVFGYIRLRNGPKHTDFTDYIAQRVKPTGQRFTGPVTVLTNRRTMSAGEDLVLAMRALPGVTVVGDTTAGAAGAPIPRELANGWSYQISEFIQYSRDKQPFEDVGLAPDIVVKGETGDVLARRDRAFDRALEVAP